MFSKYVNPVVEITGVFRDYTPREFSKSHHVKGGGPRGIRLKGNIGENRTYCPAEGAKQSQPQRAQ